MTKVITDFLWHTFPLILRFSYVKFTDCSVCSQTLCCMSYFLVYITRMLLSQAASVEFGGRGVSKCSIMRIRDFLWCMILRIFSVYSCLWFHNITSWLKMAFRKRGLVIWSRILEQLFPGALESVNRNEYKQNKTRPLVTLRPLHFKFDWLKGKKFLICYWLLFFSFPFTLRSGNHTETVQLEYDPNRTTYRDLLTMFWKNHNATANHKPQYMSAIFYHDEGQKKLAEQTRDEHQKTQRRPIATKILPAKTFYDAEEYDYIFILKLCLVCRYCEVAWRVKKKNVSVYLPVTNVLLIFQ